MTSALQKAPKIWDPANAALTIRGYFFPFARADFPGRLALPPFPPPFLPPPFPPPLPPLARLLIAPPFCSTDSNQRTKGCKAKAKQNGSGCDAIDRDARVTDASALGSSLFFAPLNWPISCAEYMSFLSLYLFGPPRPNLRRRKRSLAGCKCNGIFALAVACARSKVECTQEGWSL